eukprot:3485571-Amphidinium_carterae.1
MLSSAAQRSVNCQHHVAGHHSLHPWCLKTRKVNSTFRWAKELALHDPWQLRVAWDREAEPHSQTACENSWFV